MSGSSRAAAVLPPRSRPLARRFMPPIFTQPDMENLADPVNLPADTSFPEPSFTRALPNHTHTSKDPDTDSQDASLRKATSRSPKTKLPTIPQCIAHRGYRSKYPENTLLAFQGAIEAGAHALETDIHLTKDDVVMLSHDATLARCFGRPDRIVDLTYAEVAELRTVAEPKQAMPRLLDLLAYLDSDPERDELWVLLDIKLDNDAEKVMRLIAETLAAPLPSSSLSPSSSSASSTSSSSITPRKPRDWRSRVVLGIWAAKYLPLASKYLPGYSVTYIGFSLSYARHFFDVPHISFNLLFQSLLGPGGKRFLYDAREKHQRPVYAWTVNSADGMRWCMRQRLDGVITDDPKLFREVSGEFDDGKRAPIFALGWKGYYHVYRIWIMVAAIAWMFFTPVKGTRLIRWEGKKG